MCCHHKSVYGLDKQSGFSIAPVAQYCSVTLERVNNRIVNCTHLDVMLAMANEKFRALHLLSTSMIGKFLFLMQFPA